METKNLQYHLTFNGMISNETYIEYFNPNYFDTNKDESSSDINCANALNNLKEALNGKGISEKDCDQTFRKIHDLLCEEHSDCNPCKNQKGNENLYFLDEYQKSIDIVLEIIREWLCDSEKTDPCQRMRCQWDNLPKNNRILFHGQRGSGKTSVTMSVAKSLEGYGIGCATFKVLPIINPCYFDDDTNILKTIISNMFEMAKCIIKNENNDNQRTYHDELLKQFEEVYRLLGCIESPNKEKHTLETLNEISKASGMREAMQELINQFIKILPCKAKYLVLVIDDVDMSVAYAATMLEQINKFLELDNLLILISANLEQLLNEMREHYSKAFEKTLRDENQSLSIDVEDLASKYLLKLFPTSHRINVERPVSKLLQTEVIINNENKGSLQKAVLSLIWEKTRLLYIPKDPENTLHPIVPTNLRELAQLINLLQGMRTVEIGEKENKQKMFANKEAYENCKKNINIFKNYFFDIWVPTHLAVDEEKVFKNIPSDITEINKHLINSINVIGTDNKKRLMSREVGLDMIERNAEDVNIDRDIYTMVSPNDPRFVKANKISDIFNQPSNYSYGDLLLMIDKYETYFESEEHRRFTNAIKIYYSILLFETMFFKSSNVDYFFVDWIKDELAKGDETDYQKLNEFVEKELKNNHNNTKETIILNLLYGENKVGNKVKKELDSLIEKWIEKEKQPIPIQKLIGGTVYYPNYFEIITSKYFKQKGPSFDAKRAFYHKLVAKDKKTIGQEYPLFSVLYYGDIRPDRYDTKHIFDTTYDNNADVDGTKYVTFDILSILSNMLNPWHTINRTDNFKVYSDWDGDINKWGGYCSINNETESDIITTPNTILPFYSVDIMLMILKKQFDDESIVENAYGKEYHKIYTDLKNTKEIIVKIRDILYECKIRGGENGELINDDTIKIIDKERRLEVYRNDSKTDEESIEGNVYYNFVKILIPLSRCRSKLMIGCLSSTISGVSERLSLPELFKDHCISLILSNYKGGIKGRDALIKGLKKHSTPSEMYKYLVDQLWENDATETLIRQIVQQRIRDNKAVEYYYRELLKLMSKSSVVDKKQREVYEDIFDKACKIFIEKKNN